MEAKAAKKFAKQLGVSVKDLEVPAPKPRKNAKDKAERDVASVVARIVGCTAALLRVRPAALTNPQRIRAAVDIENAAAALIAAAQRRLVR